MTYNDGGSSISTRGDCLLQPLDRSVSQLLTADSRLFLDWLACPISACNIALGQTQQEALLPTVFILSHDVDIGMDRTEYTIHGGAPIGYVAQHDIFHCCITI